MQRIKWSYAKYTNLELDLIKGTDMYLMAEEGCAATSWKVPNWAKANLGKHGSEKPSNYIIYIDASNPCGCLLQKQHAE